MSLALVASCLSIWTQSCRCLGFLRTFSQLACVMWLGTWSSRWWWTRSLLPLNSWLRQSLPSTRWSSCRWRGQALCPFCSYESSHLACWSQWTILTLLHQTCLHQCRSRWSIDSQRSPLPYETASARGLQFSQELTFNIPSWFPPWLFLQSLNLPGRCDQAKGSVPTQWPHYHWWIGGPVCSELLCLLWSFHLCS